jgi:hypothetical protein
MARPPLRRPNSSSHPLCGGCLTRICPAGGLEYRFSGVGRPPGAVRFDPRMSVQLRRNRLCLTGPISVPRNHTSHNAARGGADHPEHCRWPIATGRPVVAPTARQIVRLPEGNQAKVLETVRREALSSAELTGVVDLWLGIWRNRILPPCWIELRPYRVANSLTRAYERAIDL